MSLSCGFVQSCEAEFPTARRKSEIVSFRSEDFGLLLKSYRSQGVGYMSSGLGLKSCRPQRPVLEFSMACMLDRQFCRAELGTVARNSAPSVHSCGQAHPLVPRL